jgi:hypothetical protein
VCETRRVTGTARPLRLLVCLAIGAAAAVVGLLPWIITGMRLPLQNLWAVDALPGAMPIALLPFSQYTLLAMAAMLVTGAAVAGLTARILRERLAPRGTLAVAGGVVLVQLVAIVQTSVVVRAGLRSDVEGRLYFGLVLAAIVVSVLLGLLTFWLIATRPRAGALVGFALGALAAAMWISALIVPLSSPSPSALQLSLLATARWIPAVLIGVAIAWCGLATVGRAVAAVGTLVMLWLAPAVTSAIGAAAGSRVYARMPAELLAFAGQVFVTALGVVTLSVLPVVVAIVIAAAGLVVRRSVRGTGRGRPAAPASDSDGSASPS